MGVISGTNEMPFKQFEVKMSMSGIVSAVIASRTAEREFTHSEQLKANDQSRCPPPL